jgi:hypothetical protein
VRREREPSARRRRAPVGVGPTADAEEDGIGCVGASYLELPPADDAAPLAAERRSANVFGAPLISRTQVVVSRPGGLSLAEQAALARFALDVSRPMGLGQEAISRSGECSYIALPAPELMVVGLPGSGGCPDISDPAWDQARQISNALAAAATAGGGGTPPATGSVTSTPAPTPGSADDAVAAARAFIGDPPDNLAETWASPGLSFRDGAYDISGAGLSADDPSFAFVCALSTVKGPAFEPNAPDGFYTLLRFALRYGPGGWEVSAIEGPNYVWPQDGSGDTGPEDVQNPGPSRCPGREP